MTETEPLTEEQCKVLLDCYKMLIRWGREAEEAPRNAVYEGMTPEERGIAVYEKCDREGLKWEDMTLLERQSWLAQWKRQMAELDREHERLDNAFWNIDHHSFLIDRIRGGVHRKLTTEERAAFMELLKSCHWGKDEVAQVKEMIETAEWFSKLKTEQNV